MMLTTIDNPYDPNVQYDEWFAFDTLMGYNTCAYLARVCFSSNELSEADQEVALDQAMNDIIELDPLGIYKKV